MKILTLIILLWVYALSVSGFIKIFKVINQDLLIINLSAEHIALLFGIIGLFLGIGYYLLSILPQKIKTILTIGIPSTILILILSSYLIGDISGFFNLLYNFLKLGIFFVVSGIPSIATYSLLKNQKNVLLACGAGIMIFFFMIIFLSQITKLNLVTIYSENQIPMMLLFFVFFLIFIEIGSKSIYYSNSLSKITPNQYIDQNSLFRFNNVINKQLLFTSAIFTICYFTSLILLLNNNYSRFFEFNRILGVESTSYFGIILLVFFTLTGLTILWFLIPQEKEKTKPIDE